MRGGGGRWGFGEGRGGGEREGSMFHFGATVHKTPVL